MSKNNSEKNHHQLKSIVQKINVFNNMMHKPNTSIILNIICI